MTKMILRNGVSDRADAFVICGYMIDTNIVNEYETSRVIDKNVIMKMKKKFYSNAQIW